MTTIDMRAVQRAVLRRERLLPIPGEVLVKPGDEVRPDTIIAKTEVLPGDPYVIDLRSELRQKLTAAEVGKAMLKRVGERVKANEVIAQISKGIFSEVVTVKSPVDGVIEFVSRAYGRVLIREDPRSALPVSVVPVARQLDVWPATIRMYLRYREGDEVKQGAALADSPGVTGVDYSYAPISGIIEKIDTRTGTVTIVRPARPTMVEAYLAGHVESVTPEYGAVIACNAALVQGVFGIGFENWGYLRMVSDDPQHVVAATDLPGELRDQVIVAGAKITAEAVRKAAAGGAKGVICGGMDHIDLVSIAGQEIGVGITGQEDVPLTIVLTEGFGTMPMAEWTFDLLREHEGRLVSFNGTTQVRAGVIRPEVIIPIEDDGLEHTEVTQLGGQAGRVARELAPGVTVRVLRKPYFGMWGEVQAVPVEPERLETESLVRVVRIRLQDGRDVTVPQENVEVF